jgi:hypothetical protein
MDLEQSLRGDQKMSSMECTEEIKVGEFTATLPYELATRRGALRERNGCGWSRSGGRNRDWFWWCGPDLESVLRRSWLGRGRRNRRDEPLGGDGKSVFLNLSSGNSSGLRDNSGVQLDCELLILLLKGGSIVAIVSVLERNRLDSQSLYIEGKPHGSTSEVPGFGQGDTWSTICS